MWWVYVLLCLVSGFAYARFDPYFMDGDSVSFLDIADGLRSHHASLAINSYWNPAYPALLAAVQAIVHPSRWHELEAYAYLNALIFAACLFAVVYVVNGLVHLQSLLNPGRLDDAAVSPLALRYVGAALLVLSFQRELPMGFVRSDPLLLLLFLLAAGLLLRIQIGGRLWRYAALGLVLGLAYLTKSFAFLPSGFLFLGMLIFGLTRKGEARRRIAFGAVLAGVVFLAVAGPYIAAISHQMGHVTTGESARLNYAFFVDETPRWHEGPHGDLGHAGGVFLHPEITLLKSPWVFSFRNHPVGTFPLWFDPAYFTAGLKPHVWLTGHIRRLVRCTQLLVLWLIGHPEGPLLLAVLLASGAVFRRPRKQLAMWLVVPAWGLLMIGIYFPIDLQERYLTAVLLLGLLPVLALLRRPGSAAVVRVGNGLAVLLALIAISGSFREILDLRRHLHIAGRSAGLYSPQIFGAAEGLVAMGLKPGDAVGCMGGHACYLDPYWARLAQVQILGEVEIPDTTPADVAWNQIADKAAVEAALRSQGLRVLVTWMPTAGRIPQGWQQLGSSAYFAYPLTESR